MFKMRNEGSRWLSGRASDSGVRGLGLEPQDYRIVSLSKGPGNIYWYHGAGAKCHGADTFFYSLSSMEPILFLHLQPWGRYFFQSLFTHGADTFLPLILKTLIKLVYIMV